MVYITVNVILAETVNKTKMLATVTEIGLGVAFFYVIMDAGIKKPG